jgi:hypothetical protein
MQSGGITSLQGVTEQCLDFHIQQAWLAWLLNQDTWLPMMRTKMRQEGAQASQSWNRGRSQQQEDVQDIKEGGDEAWAPSLPFPPHPYMTLPFPS